MKKILLILLFLQFINIIFPQETTDLSGMSEKQIMKLFEKTVESRDKQIQSYLLQLDPLTAGYGKFEEFLLDRAEDFSLNGDLDYPLYLIESVLYNNMENIRAQNLYSIIINKSIEIEERRREEELKAEKKRAELEEYSETLEESVSQEENLVSIIATNQDLLSTIVSYSDIYEEIHYISNSYFYPFSTRFYESQVYDSYHNRDSKINSYTGMGFDSGLGIALKPFIYRMDLSGVLTYDDLFNNNIKQIAGNFILSAGYRIGIVPVYFRLGFLYDAYLYDSMKDTQMALTSISSGTVGVSVTGLRVLNIVKIDLSSDYLLAPLYTDNLDYAFSSKLFITLNLFRFGKYNIELRGGVSYLEFQEVDLKEYSLIPRFGFGISSYD